jgi:dipeptidyl aminopeptidase/acylaminoacyl peptidase
VTDGTRFLPADLARLPDIVAADLAPNGEFCVYAATTRDGKTALEHSVLWRQPIGGAAEPIADVGDGQDAPAVSPDGSKVAYLQRVDGRAQLAVVDLASGMITVRTGFDRGVGPVTPCWSPDGSTLAFTASDAPARDRRRPYRITRPVWRRDGMGLIDDVATEVWTVPADGGAPTRLTRHDGVVSGLAWSPDGGRILYVGFGEPGSARFAIRTVTADGNRVHDVAALDYLVYPPAASWLPDGRIVRTTAWDVNRALDLVVHDCATGIDTPLGIEVDGQINGIVAGSINRALFEPRLIVDQDKGEVYFCVQRGGRAEVGRVSGAGEGLGVACSGDYAATPLALRGRRVLVARTSLREPAHLAVVDVDDGTEHPIQALDTGWLDQEPFRVHELRFGGDDGTPVAGWYLEPPYGSAPHPTVLSIHGGPFAASGHAFSAEHHLLTGAGYGVLAVNYRGSSGYGESFAKCLLGDWGRHDAGDLLAGLEHAISCGLVDETRLGLFGRSAGGYLTGWLLTHSHRFAAGVAECPVTEWNGMLGSDIPWLVSRWMGTEPGRGPAAMAAYVERSPAAYAADCTTPTLILQYEADLRCPNGQGDVLYNTLTMAGRTTEMLVFPDMSHAGAYGVANLPGRMERLASIVEWFERFMPARKTNLRMDWDASRTRE